MLEGCTVQNAKSLVLVADYTPIVLGARVLHTLELNFPRNADVVL